MFVFALFLDPLSAKAHARYWEGGGRYNDERELAPAIKGSDGPTGKVDRHVWDTRKWLFRFFFDRQAVCKDLSCVNARPRPNSFKKTSFQCGGGEPVEGQRA